MPNRVQYVFSEFIFRLLQTTNFQAGIESSSPAFGAERPRSLAASDQRAGYHRHRKGVGHVEEPG